MFSPTHVCLARFVTVSRVEKYKYWSTLGVQLYSTIRYIQTEAICHFFHQQHPTFQPPRQWALVTVFTARPRPSR
jgi:hypothetical protein